MGKMWGVGHVSRGHISDFSGSEKRKEGLVWVRVGMEQRRSTETLGWGGPLARVAVRVERRG